MQETGVQSLGREDPLEEGTAAHSSILAGRIPWTDEPGGCSPWSHKESDTTETDTFTLTQQSQYSGDVKDFVVRHAALGPYLAS